MNFAQSPLVIGYNPASRFAADLKSKPWYEVLQEPGIRIGRTDPKLDPKGALTVSSSTRPSRSIKLPVSSQKVLGAPDNPAQVRPEENLVGQPAIRSARCRLLLLDRDVGPANSVDPVAARSGAQRALHRHDPARRARPRRAPSSSSPSCSARRDAR